MIRTQDSLAELIESEQFIPYIEADDPRDKKVRWTVFGDFRYDLLWIVLANVTTGEQVIECIKSILSTPMKDRVHGIDPADAGLVQAHADDMWNKYEDRIKTS